jgi:amino acid adenylation domain-containing protein
MADHPYSDSFRYAPLSYEQLGIWLLCFRNESMRSLNLSRACWIPGSIDTPVIKQSILELADRFEILRTTYPQKDGTPIQKIHAQLEPMLNVVDVSCWSRDQFNQKILKSHKQHFDLLNGPLFRVYLFSRDKNQSLILLTAHNICVDEWSIKFLIGKLQGLCLAAKRTSNNALRSRDQKYSDFAVHQKSIIESDKGQHFWNFWRKTLAGTLPVLSLKTDYKRMEVKSYKSNLKSFLLGHEVYQLAKSFTDKEKYCLHDLFLSAFEILLYKYSQQTDIILGMPSSLRNGSEFEKVVGNLDNTIVLRTDFSDNPTFKRFLQATVKRYMDSLAFKEYPLGLLIEKLALKSDSSRSMLFQTYFSYKDSRRLSVSTENGLSFKLKNLNEELESSIIVQQKGLYDLSLEAVEEDENIRCNLIYDPELFESQTIVRMAKHYQVIINAVLTDPEQNISDISLLTDDERDQLIREWNNTAASYPDNLCIHQAFEKQAAQTPEAIAVIQGKKQISFQELNRRANQLAHHLRSLGVQHGSLVGISIDRSIDMIVGLLAVLKAGGAYVPLDPTYPKERLAYMLSDSNIPVLLTMRSTLMKLPETDAMAVCLDSEWERISVNSEANLPNKSTPDQVAYVVYTSGSTGTPKGVQGLHRGAMNRFNWMWENYSFKETETCCQKTALSFVDSIWEIFGPLLKGVKTVIIPDEIVKDAYKLIEALAQNCVTRIVLVPSLLKVILNVYSDLQKYLPKLNFWISSGETSPKELALHFKKVLPQSTLLNLYGSSEVSADVTFFDTKFINKKHLRVPIGRPIANTQIYILDAHLNSMPIGIVGEIYVGGEGLSGGYLNLPKLTKNRFIKNPFRDDTNALLFKTGDLGKYLPDGNIDLVGRVDHQVKIRGYRIEIGEIEFALQKLHGVDQAIVTTVESPSGETRLAAFTVPSKPEGLNAVKLRAALRSFLPEYMIPSFITILEKIPLTPSGKVDRLNLPDPFKAQKMLPETSAPPRSELEKNILNIWKEVLHIKIAGIDDNFFDLGGHSLLLAQVHSRLEKIVQSNISIVDLFQYPTVASLSQFITSRQKKSLSLKNIRERARMQRKTKARKKAL